MSVRIDCKDAARLVLLHVDVNNFHKRKDLIIKTVRKQQPAVRFMPRIYFYYIIVTGWELDRPPGSCCRHT